ncbi:hypothetical protein [uncultured Ruminococcus sp.]|uniref:hypothetical protein n=1 Tax=uncultured Ruminococcus sp. TaxID=165186 RepID=UPI00292E7C7B|nr:hypothetical protein [uncultured Ruminococcus sp.]
MTPAAKPPAVSSAALDAETSSTSPPFGYKKTALNHLGAVSKKFHSVQVFVLQNKMLFQANGAQLLKNVFPRMIASAEEKGFWFIFSDVRKVGNNDRDTESSLNNSIAAAFLLDNISEFVSDRGSRSVFGEMDPKELKSEYARCSVGDGYYYDIESDDLKKIKIIKAD